MPNRARMYIWSFVVVTRSRILTTMCVTHIYSVGELTFARRGREENSIFARREVQRPSIYRYPNIGTKKGPTTRVFPLIAC